MVITNSSETTDFCITANTLENGKFVYLLTVGMLPPTLKTYRHL